MSFDWREYLSIAEAQCGRAITGAPAGVEANRRSAVSRAYYACHISARNRLRDHDNVTLPAGNGHTTVRTEYENHIDPRRRQIGVGDSVASEWPGTDVIMTTWYQSWRTSHRGRWTPRRDFLRDWRHSEPGGRAGARGAVCLRRSLSRRWRAKRKPVPLATLPSLVVANGFSTPIPARAAPR